MRSKQSKNLGITWHSNLSKILELTTLPLKPFQLLYTPVLALVPALVPLHHHSA